MENMKQITVIDSLYVYGTKDITEEFYYNFVEQGLVVRSGFADGYEWFQEISTKNRIGICTKEQAIKMSSYPVVIQYSKHSSHSHDFRTYGSVRNYTDLKVKRLDVAITFQDKEYSIFPNVISPFTKKNIIFGAEDAIETIYLGARATGKQIRHYNKTKELQDTKNYSDMDYYANIFDGSIDGLYTIESELHRKHIMAKFGDVTLDSLANLINYSLSIINLCVFFPTSENNIINYRNNNYDDIEGRITHYSEDVNYVKTFVEVSKAPSFQNLTTSITRSIDNYIKAVYGTLGDNSSLEHFYIKLIHSLLERKHYQIDEIEIDIESCETLVDYKNLMKKVQLLRDNQDNSLEIEFKHYFS